jgi:nitrilase
MRPDDRLTVGAVQMAPVWLDRQATLDRVCERANDAADQGCELVVFGEAILPGYPFWIERTDGARFESPVQKRLHAHYMDQAVQLERGDLDALTSLAASRKVTIVVGCIERPLDRGGHSVYASLVTIGGSGRILNVHRKLVPTHEERLTWSPGDGHGLCTQELKAFRLGALNCWENWMPLARTALYAQGEDLHVALWPGGEHNTRDLTRFIAREGRSYVISVSGLCRPQDVPATTPHRELIVADAPEFFANGGTSIAGPDGEWVSEPLVEEEGLVVAELNHERVRQERQNFDATGHYGRPDVLRLQVDRHRQTAIEESDLSD